VESLIREEDHGLIHLVHGSKKLSQTKALYSQHSQVIPGFQGDMKVVVYLIGLCQWLHEGRVQARGRRRLGGGLGLAAGLDCGVLEPDFKEGFLAMDFSVDDEGVSAQGWMLW